MSASNLPSGSAENEPQDDSTRLKRNLGLMSGVTLIVGTMIGEFFIGSYSISQTTSCAVMWLIFSSLDDPL